MDEIWKKMDIFMMADDQSIGNTASTMRRREGFAGQRVVVLPESTHTKMAEDAWLADLYPVACGAFPRAIGHHVVRQKGVPEAILISVKEGSGWVGGAGKLTYLNAGEFCLIPAGVAHEYGATGEDPWAIQWVHFRGRSAAEIVNEISNACHAVGRTAIVTDKCLELRVDLSGIRHPLENGYSFPNLLRSALALRTVLQAILLARLKDGKPEDPVERLLIWMNNCLKEKAALPEMAAIAGVSIPHLCVIFKKTTGSSPAEYFVRLKLQRAAQLLDTTDYRVGEIAAILGWTDPYHFSRLFKRLMGHCPRTYRQIPKG